MAPGTPQPDPADHARNDRLRPGRLEWRDIPAPETPGPDAAVVAPVAVATCDLDRSLALGATPFPLGFTIGHECVAEVLCVGNG